LELVGRLQDGLLALGKEIQVEIQFLTLSLAPEEAAVVVVKTPQTKLV
jgi:hypothetical protein